MPNELIGRSIELQALTAFVETIPLTGRALLLQGEAGVGKTSLWREGIRLAAERGTRVLSARSSPSETTIAFAIIGDLLAPVVDEALPLLVPIQRRALESALLLREPGGSPTESRVLGLALVSVVHALAQESPVLLAVDDLQWVDGSSAAVLAFMLRRLEGEPVGVLGTVRGRPVEAPLELDHAFEAFERSTVAPLSVGAIHRLLWGRLALSLPRPILIRVHEISGGNPFFALELGRAIVDGSIRTDADEPSLPESLRALVANRVGALPRRVRNSLVAVAALASPSITLLEPYEPTIIQDIESARERGILKLEGDRIGFTHPLLAPACYELMPLHRRRQVHRRLADLDVGLEERARHLALAAAGPDEEIAEALDAAAAHASARGAAQAAAELAERALVLTPTALADDVGRRRIAAGVLCAFAGDPTKARTLLEEAVETTAPGPLRSEALCRLADVQDGLDGTSITPRFLLDALAEPGVGRRQRATILTKLGFNTRVGQVTGGWSRRVRYARAGLELAEELADPELLVASLTVLAHLEFWRTGRIQRDLLDRAIELSRIRSEPSAGSRRPALADPSSPLTHEPRTNLAQQLGVAGHFDEARGIWSELIAGYGALDDPNVVWSMLALASMEVRAGRWEVAAKLCHEAMELNRQMGRELAEPFGLLILGEIDLHRGEAELASGVELLRAAERLDSEPQTYRLWRVLASLELCRDDPRAAWRQVASPFEDLDEMDTMNGHVAGSVAIEALIGIGDLRTAERLLALLDEWAADADTPLRALARRCRGLLLSARGDHEGAIVELDAAAAAPLRPQEAEPLELARTLLALGCVRRKAQHKRAARETLERALEIFEELGSRPWAARTRSELRRIGGRIASDGALSETERRIVDLVIAGRRNREVADELSLSPNTVAWNLSKIYRKLGVASRTELAAHVTANPTG